MADLLLLAAGFCLGFTLGLTGWALLIVAGSVAVAARLALR